MDPANPIASMAAPVILTQAAFDALKVKYPAAKFPTRRNQALNLGGSFDLVTTSTGLVFAVVKFAKLTDKIAAEITPILQAAQAKLTPPAAS